jgi:hypothetical protein
VRALAHPFDYAGLVLIIIGIIQLRKVRSELSPPAQKAVSFIVVAQRAFLLSGYLGSSIGGEKARLLNRTIGWYPPGRGRRARSHAC